MNRMQRLRFWASIGIIVAATTWIGWSAAVRVRHCDEVSGFGGGSELAQDAASPTGYAGGVRPLVVPVRDPRSLQWILQAQDMQARGVWRLDRVSYDNAPAGREVWSPSPYRWWLVFIGRIHALMTGAPVAASIERAALWADPALHVLLVLIAAALAWRGAGAAAATCCAVMLAAVFPLGLTFLPGRPDEVGLGLLCLVLAVLPLAVVLTRPAGRRARLWFLAAGAFAGLGLWVNMNQHLIVLAGILLGGGVSACWRRRTGDMPATAAEAAPHWRTWAVAGAAVAAVAWLAECAPDRLALADARWDVAHPGLVLVWLGCGELLARLEAWSRRGRAAPGAVALAACLVATGLIIVPLFLAVRDGMGAIFGPGEALTRVHDFARDVVDGGAWAWLGEKGVSLAVVAALAPMLSAAAVAVWALVRNGLDVRMRGCVAFLAIIVAVALAGAAWRPGDWAAAAVACSLLTVPIAGSPLRVVALWGVLASSCLGVWISMPTGGAGASRDEVRSLIERDLAWWLASQAPERDAIVLAPPDLTAALIYHGGLRGLGSPYRENEDGFRFSVRLAAASTPDEGQALVDNRGVRYIIVPSWDDFLDQYARLGANQPDKTLIALLHQWLPPRWLRALPYMMPQVEGFAGESVAVFQVVDLQDNTTALSRLAEYFVETGRMTHARRLAAALKEHYPTEPAAFIARAQVAAATRDAGGFREIIEALLPMLEDGSAETLTWDRRVSLALVLAQARHLEAARRETQRCLDEIDEPALRSLTNPSLQRFLALVRSLDLEFADPHLRDLANRLLPAEMRTS